MADLLNRAEKAAEDMGIEIREKIFDQHNFHIGYRTELSNGRQAVYLAGKFDVFEGLGMAKSFDYHIVHDTHEKQHLIQIYIEFPLRGDWKIYQIPPADIINVAEERPFSNGIPDDETICPLCGTEMELGHSHEVERGKTPCLEVHNHRLKYYRIPFNAIDAVNLDRTGANPKQEHEEYLLYELQKRGVKVDHKGNKPSSRKNFGFAPDFVIYSHEGSKCRLLELGNKSEAKKRELRRKAEEEDCVVRFLEYSPAEVKQKTDEIVSEVLDWVGQKELNQFGVADD